MTLTGWLRYDRVRPLVPPGTVSILEIGCGMGAMGALLARSYDYTGIEPDARSFAAARARVVGGRVFNVDAAGRAEGWEAHLVALDDDGSDEVVFYCPVCAEREFHCVE